LNRFHRKQGFTLILSKIKSMTTVQLNVSEDIIRAYGVEAIQQRLQRFLEWERLALAAKAIQAAVENAGLDHDEIWKEARHGAWQEFKAKNLKELLP
jgi:hypothetical protein